MLPSIIRRNTDSSLSFFSLALVLFFFSFEFKVVVHFVWVLDAVQSEINRIIQNPVKLKSNGIDWSWRHWTFFKSESTFARPKRTINASLDEDRFCEWLVIDLSPVYTYIHVDGCDASQNDRIYTIFCCCSFHPAYASAKSQWPLEGAPFFSHTIFSSVCCVNEEEWKRKKRKKDKAFSFRRKKAAPKEKPMNV